MDCGARGVIEGSGAIEGTRVAWPVEQAIARSLEVSVVDHEAVFMQHQPTNALVEAEDVAAAAVWLASDESRHTTGSVITVDGGFTAR